MSVIRISPEEVEAGAQLFHTKSQEIADDVNTLQNEVDRFTEIWEGKALQAFQNEFSILRKDIDKFVQLVDDIGTQLTSIKQAMIDSDQEIANQLGL